MDSKVVIALVCLVIIVQASDENYCDPTLCEDGLTHTACDHYLEFAQECGEDPEFVVLTSAHKKLILDLHNIHRDRIAGGKLPGYAPAARMPVLKWNEDLAYVAGLHARSCTTENDGCRNTRIYKNVGQNIGYDSVGEPIHNTTAVIRRIIESWYGEYKLGNQANIKALNSESQDSMGRFLMMVNDHTDAVGCECVKFTKDDLYNFFFICNYSSNLRLDEKVYETGTPCTNCNSGCNRMFPHLCSSDEKIDPNHYYVETLRSFN